MQAYTAPSLYAFGSTLLDGKSVVGFGKSLREEHEIFEEHPLSRHR